MCPNHGCDWRISDVPQAVPISQAPVVAVVFVGVVCELDACTNTSTTLLLQASVVNGTQLIPTSSSASKGEQQQLCSGHV